MVGWIGIFKIIVKVDIKSKFKATKILSLSCKAIDDKTKPSNVYKTTPHTLNDEDDNSKASDDNQQWGAHEVDKELMNLTTIIKLVELRTNELNNYNKTC